MSLMTNSLSAIHFAFFITIILNFARVGGLQSQGAKGEAVIVYCEPLATQDLKSSGAPEG
jgi:hypothetical protein